MIKYWHYKDDVFEPIPIAHKDLVFVCIGTDRSTGDALGPIVGSTLQGMGVPNVYGTLKETVNALNIQSYKKYIKDNHPDATVIAIDACLSKHESVGTITFKDTPLKPGAGVNKDLGEIGDYSLYGVVNVGGLMEYFVLQNTSLNLVMEMSKSIVKIIEMMFLSEPQIAI